MEKLLAAAYDRLERSCHFSLVVMTFPLQHTHTHRYLSKLLPPPTTIPVTVNLTVPEKSFNANDILLRPDESMGNIVKKLKSLMEKEGMEIAEFPSCDEFAVSIIRYNHLLIVSSEDGGGGELASFPVMGRGRLGMRL